MKKYGNLIIAIVIVIAFWQSWMAYQAGDDHTFYRVREDVIHKTILDDQSRQILILTAPSGYHWSPLSNLILFQFIQSDRLGSLVIFNLCMVFALAVITRKLALTMDVQPFFALISGLWIGASQSLVLPVCSVWGPVNLMPSVLLAFAALALWRWSRSALSTQIKFPLPDHCFFMYPLLLLLAFGFKESAVRGVIIFPVITLGVVLFNRRNIRFLMKYAVLSIVFAVVVFMIIITLRFVLTDVPIPLIRPPENEGYHTFSFSITNSLKNAAMLFAGVLTPINSYQIYLKIIANQFGLVLALSAPLILLTIIFVALYFRSLMKNQRIELFKIFFLSVLFVNSFFPEIFLGKVSEMYSAAPLWVTAVLLSFLLSKAVTKFFKRLVVETTSKLIMSLLVFIMCISTQFKVREILKTGLCAHKIRESIHQHSQFMKAGSHIAVVAERRNDKAFARFGERGVQANGGLFIPDTQVHWSKFYFDQIDKIDLAGFDKILIENKENCVLELDQTFLYRSD